MAFIQQRQIYRTLPKSCGHTKHTPLFGMGSDGKFRTERQRLIRHKMCFVSPGVSLFNPSNLGHLAEGTDHFCRELDTYHFAESSVVQRSLRQNKESLGGINWVQITLPRIGCRSLCREFRGPEKSQTEQRIFWRYLTTLSTTEAPSWLR
eukprot:10780677-Karenia_brevis.AAC.1